MRGPYLQNLSTNAITVRWRTDVATDSVVSFGTTADALTTVAGDAALVTDHVVRLTNLVPGTRYFYRVGTGFEKPAAPNAEDAPGAPAINSFVTPPPAGTAEYEVLRNCPPGGGGGGITSHGTSTNSNSKPIRPIGLSARADIAGPAYSTVIFPSAITFAHFAVSLRK